MDLFLFFAAQSWLEFVSFSAPVRLVHCAIAQNLETTLYAIFSISITRIISQHFNMTLSESVGDAFARQYTNLFPSRLIGIKGEKLDFDG